MMLDKLTLTTPEPINLEWAATQLQGQYTHRTLMGSPYYGKVEVFHNGNKDAHVVSIYADPRHSTTSPTRLEINPSRHSSFSKLTAFLGQIIDPDKAKICRLDQCVDLNLPTERIFRSLNWSRKKCRETFREGKDLTGFQLGRMPEMLCVYDKAKRLRVEGPITRIELRQAHAKVLIQKIRNLPRLIDIRPFSSLRFLMPRHLRDDDNPNNEMKLCFMNDLTQTRGFHGFYKLRNSHSNFQRDWNQLLEPDPDIPDLDQKYNIELKHFFHGDDHGIK